VNNPGQTTNIRPLTKSMAVEGLEHPLESRGKPQSQPKAARIPARLLRRLPF